MKNFFLAFCLMLFIAPGAVQATEVDYVGPEEWEQFDQFMLEREREDEITGLSYLISGALATVGGNVGYYSSTDPFSRGAFALTQSVGIVAMGYGASIYWNGNDFGSFYRAVRDSSLSPGQKTELLQRFLQNERAQKERSRWIRMGTHVLLAAVNLYSASQEQDKDVKRLFQFLGGVNAVIAFTYAF